MEVETRDGEEDWDMVLSVPLSRGVVPDCGDERLNREWAVSPIVQN